jgi:histidinol-phosphate phosphatase family protein
MNDVEGPLIYQFNSALKGDKLLLVDRDNTLVEDLGYTYLVSELRFMPQAIEALKYAKSLGYLIAIVTNQSGIARGLFSRAQMELFHLQLVELLNQSKVNVELILVCPHLPSPKGHPICSCRKPNTEMLEKAMKILQVERQNTIIVGDKKSDIESGKKLGLCSALTLDFENLLTCLESVLIK